MMSYDTLKVLTQYWVDIGSPCSLKLAEACNNGNWNIVLKILGSLDQSKEMCPYRHRRARLAVDIIKKADYLPIDVDKELACVQSYCIAEKQCRDTNLRFTRVGMNHPLINWDKVLLVKRVARLMKRMLGPIPDLLYFQGAFGPGSTLSNPRRCASVYEKLDIKNPTVTHQGAWFYPALPSRLRDVWGDVNKLNYVSANRFITVPKNYKTFRGICVEPLINAYIQRGFGLYLKDRLRKFNIDIDSGKEIHMRLAREGSISGEYSTLDMSMASDTVAIGVLREVLPRDWFTLLDRCRTPYTDLNSVYDKYSSTFREAGILKPVHLTEKFSSMGNGFTFELETMLFIAIARACGDKTARSFGDDLIIKTPYYQSVKEALTFFGFTLNDEKSFSRGSFRESCGGDYRRGINVKGVTLKTEPRCVDDWYNLHNRLYLMSKEFNIDIRRTLHVIRAQVPKHLRFAIPEYLGTGGFFSENPRPTLHNDGMLHYRTYRRYRFQPDKDWSNKFRDDVLLAAILLGGDANGPDSGQRTSWRVVWDPPFAREI